MNRKAILAALRRVVGRGGGAMLPEGGSRAALERGARAQTAAEAMAEKANQRFSAGAGRRGDDALLDRAQRQSVANEYLTRRVGARSIGESEAMHADALAAPSRPRTPAANPISVVDGKFTPRRSRARVAAAVAAERKRNPYAWDNMKDNEVEAWLISRGKLD